MKIICIYHSVDLDGWMSAAIVEHCFLTTKNNKSKIIPDEYSIGYKKFIEANPNSDSLYFMGWNYGNPIPDLTEYDKVIMCDLSFPHEEMVKIANELGLNFIWIDHHKSAIESFRTSDVDNYYPNGIRDINFSACELTWKYFFGDKIPEIVRLLGRYDCFGHKGTSEESYVLEFQYGARAVIEDRHDAYGYLMNCIKNNVQTVEHIYNIGKPIYDFKCKEAKQAIAKGFTILFGEYRFLAINVNRLNPINFGIDYHSIKADDIYFYDGVASYWIEPDGIHFSLYNDNGLVDCSKIATSLGGGGHKGASGFIMPFRDGNVISVRINEFKSLIESIRYNSTEAS